MPAAKPPEFRRRAVELARQGQQPVAKIASDLGISESCLRRWMAVDDVDCRSSRGPDQRRASRAGGASPPYSGAGDGERDPQAGLGLLRSGERPPKIVFRLVHELAADRISIPSR